MNRIKALRERKNLSQAQLAEMLGVSTKTVQAWECGEKTPDEHTIAMLCCTLECTSEYLFGRTEYNPPLYSTKPREDTAYRIQPITCPRCGRSSLSFVAEYHKDFHSRIWALIALTAGIILIFFTVKYEFDPDYLIANIFCFVAYVLFHIKTIFTEARTHVKSICRDCGHIWLLD